MMDDAKNFPDVDCADPRWSPDPLIAHPPDPPSMVADPMRAAIEDEISIIAATLRINHGLRRLVLSAMPREGD